MIWGEPGVNLPESESGFWGDVYPLGDGSRCGGTYLVVYLSVGFGVCTQLSRRGL